MLLQYRQIRTVIDVEYMSVDDQCWDRVAPRFFGFGNACFLLPQMDAFDGEAGCIEGRSHRLFRTDANGATSV